MMNTKKVFYIINRILKDEMGTVLSLSLAFFIPLGLGIFVKSFIIRNLSVFLLSFPLAFYPLFFLLRGVSITKKEWIRHTVYIYKTNPITSLEYETAYLLYFILEALYFTIIPLVFLHILSHHYDTLLKFSIASGTFFVSLPLFVLSFSIGRFLYLLSRSIYIKRNTISFFTGILWLFVFLKVYFIFKKYIPSPFKFKVATMGTGTLGVYHIGGFSFVYSLLWLFLVFILNLYMWKMSEG